MHDLLAPTALPLTARPINRGSMLLPTLRLIPAAFVSDSPVVAAAGVEFRMGFGKIIIGEYADDVVRIMSEFLFALFLFG